MDLETDEDLHAPDADRVAARAMVLAAVAWRGLIENEESTDERGAEDVRRDIVTWLDGHGLSTEVEEAEMRLLATPVGKLGRKAIIDACWRSEGLAVLAWALHRATLPSVHTLCEPVPIAKALGFLEDREATGLPAPMLRNSAEIEHWAHTYLALHWRMREFSLRAVRIDFVSYAAKCRWARLELNDLEVIDDDLAIQGVRIDLVDQRVFRDVLSITIERRIALDWLLGFELLYSEVTTDT